MVATDIQKQVKRSRLKRKAKENLSAWAFLAPYMVIFTIFFIVPFFYSMYISLHDWNLFRPELTTFNGLNNYKQILFNKDSIFYSLFWNGLKNTLLFVVISVPLLMVIPLLLAVLINVEPPGYKIFRMLLFLPTVLSISAVVLIWRWQFNTNGGFINSILVKLGMGEISFLQTQPWAWISILVVTIWWTSGTNMVIFGAGLKNIDKSMYEAASIDGANAFQSFFRLTLPSLAPQFFVTLFMTLLASFNIYGQPALLTNGGPSKSTTVLMMYIREYAMGVNSKPGIASAMAILLGLVMIIVGIAQAVLLKKRGDQQ